MMIDAHIHRVIVVDEERRPIGVVSNAKRPGHVAGPRRRPLESLGERWYKQEYECSFEDPVGAVFSADRLIRRLT
jgi:hypothetical protein